MIVADWSFCQFVSSNCVVGYVGIAFGETLISAILPRPRSFDICVSVPGWVECRCLVRCTSTSYLLYGNFLKFVHLGYMDPVLTGVALGIAIVVEHLWTD